MAPSIELTYSSRAGNGPLGLGFGISSLSNITRCRKSLAHEEAAEGVTFEPSDRFCLDGQKLEIVAGTYGADNAEYRTERFSGSQIKSYGLGRSSGEPAWFEVRSSNGRILKYGPGSDSTLWALYRANWGDVAARSATFGWLLQTELDRFGNGIHYDYEAFGTVPDSTWNAQRKLTQIRYTSNNGAGLPSTRLIRFIYEPRADVVEQAIAGMDFRWNERLSKIEVLGPKVPDGSAELLWTYRLEYEASPGAGLSRLASVAWCDADGGCLPSTRFEWGAEGGFEEGTTDLKYREIWRAAQGVSTDHGSFTQVQLVDLDGDGRDDLVYEPLHPSEAVDSTRVHQSNLKARLSTGRGFGAELTIDRFSGYIDNRQDGGFDQHRSRFADFDGDGRMELLAWANHDQLTTWDRNSLGWRIYRFENGALVRASSLHVPAWSGATRPTQFTDELQLADVDGDGLPDILLDRFKDLSSEVARVIHNQGNFNFGAEVPLPGAHLNGNWSYPADADGDGRAEIVNLSWNEFDPNDWPESFGILPFADPPPNYILPNGSPFSIDASKYRVRTFFAGGGGTAIPYWSTRVLADANGDGLSDLITVENAGINVYRGTGKGFASPRMWSARLSDKPDRSDLPDRHAGGVIPADFNADGLTDLLLLETADIRPQKWQATISGYAISSENPTLLISNGSSFHAVDGFAVPQVGLRVRPFGPGRRGPAWGGAAVGDIDGDGLPELAQLEKRHLAETDKWTDTNYDLVVYSQRSAPEEGTLVSDVITEVRNGMGVVESVSYRPLTDAAAYEAGTTCKLPQRCLKRGLSVVRQHRLSNAWAPAFGERNFYYKYEDARTDIRGRGFLGFRCVTSIDIARGREVKSCYRQHEVYDIPVKKACPGYAYPYAGLPTIVWTKQLVGDGHYRFTQTAHLYDDPPVWGPGHTFRTHLRYVDQVVAEGPETTIIRENGPENQQRTRIMYTYDSMGNLREQHTRVFGRDSSTPEFEERRFNQWVGADAGRWLISRLESTELQVTRRNEQMRKRVTAYEYLPDTQSPSKETVLRADDNEDVVGSVAYGRDATGVVTTLTRTDAFGDIRVDEIAYDSAKIFPRKLKNALGHVTWVGQHPSTGDLLFVRDPNAIDHAWRYDWMSRVRRYDAASGVVLLRSYGRAAELAPQIGATTGQFPMAVLTSGTTVPAALTYIDAWGQENGQIWRGADGSLFAVTTDYDALGRVRSRSLPHVHGSAPSGRFHFGYDLLDRPTRVTNPDRTEKKFEYPTFYESLVTDEGAGTSGAAKIRMVHDATGLAKQVFEDAGGADVRTDLAYDSFGNVRKVVRNASGSEPVTSESGFDTLGRVVWHMDPDRGTFRYRYSGHGHVREATHEGVSTSTFTTDSLGRVTSKTTSVSAGATEVTKFTYDELGHGAHANQRGSGEIGALTSSSSPDGVVTKHYFDAFGRPVRNCWTILGSEDCIAQTYHSASTGKAGLPAEVTYPNRPWKAGEPERLRVTLGYNSRDSSLESVSNASTGQHYWRATARSPEGFVTGAQIGALDVVNQFDALTRRIEEVRVGSGATDRMRLKYTYHPNGNVKTRQDVQGGFTDTFDYDLLNRLASWTATGSRQLTEHYDYDRLGNVLGTRNAQNQVVDDYDLARTDNAGPLGVTRFADGRTGDVFNYRYDQAKRQYESVKNGQLWQKVSYTPFDLPRKVVTRSGGADVTTVFLYDAFQSRVYKSSGTDSTTYVGGIYERRVHATQSDSTTTHVYYVQAESSVVAQIEYAVASGVHQTFHVHTDPLGSTSLVTDSAGASVQELYYSPFGRRITRSGAPAMQLQSSVRQGFTGHEHDDELGFVNMRGRMYDPRLRRFTTPDPVAFEHPYAYVNNNPLRYVDPLGFYGEDPRPTGQGVYTYTPGVGGTYGHPQGQESNGTITVGGDSFTRPEAHVQTSQAAAPVERPSGEAASGPTVGGGYDPSYGYYNGGSATGLASHGPAFGKGPPASARSEYAQAAQQRVFSAPQTSRAGGHAPPSRVWPAKANGPVTLSQCPLSIGCYHQPWVAVQMRNYRNEWTLARRVTWWFTMKILHQGGAPYDYAAWNSKVWIEFRPGQWITEGDFGNYLAGYGAGYGPLDPAGKQAALWSTFVAGGIYNRESDTGGLFGDSQRSTHFINLGFSDGLLDSLKPYYSPMTK